MLATALVRVGFRQWQLLEQQQCKADNTYHICTVLTAARYPLLHGDSGKKLETSPFAGTKQQGDVLKELFTWSNTNQGK